MAYPQLVTVAWTGADGQTYSVSLDATLSQSHEATSTVTEHPVEDGANMSDHIRPDLITLTVEGIISNTPIMLPADHADGAEMVDVEIPSVQNSIRLPIPGIGALVGNIPIGPPAKKATVRGFSPDFNRIEACHQELLKLRADGVLCQVLTQLANYESMAIRRIGVIITPETGHALPLSLEFVQVRIGSTEEVPIPEIPIARADKGSVTPVAPTEDVSDNASAAFNLATGGI